MIKMTFESINIQARASFRINYILNAFSFTKLILYFETEECNILGGTIFGNRVKFSAGM